MKVHRKTSNFFITVLEIALVACSVIFSTGMPETHAAEKICHVETSLPPRRRNSTFQIFNFNHRARKYRPDVKGYLLRLKTRLDAVWIRSLLRLYPPTINLAAAHQYFFGYRTSADDLISE
jgi:hypothetical protein